MTFLLTFHPHCISIQILILHFKSSSSNPLGPLLASALYRQTILISHRGVTFHLLINFLYGTVSQDIDLYFFMILAHLAPLFICQSIFVDWLNFTKLRGGKDTPESESAVSMLASVLDTAQFSVNFQSLFLQFKDAVSQKVFTTTGSFFRKDGNNLPDTSTTFCGQNLNSCIRCFTFIYVLCNKIAHLKNLK